jgi:hypothetical protein
MSEMKEGDTIMGSDYKHCLYVCCANAWPNGTTQTTATARRSRRTVQLDHRLDKGIVYWNQCGKGFLDIFRIGYNSPSGQILHV